MRKLLLLVCMSLCILQAWAQNRTISGTVTDEKGASLSNVTVTIKGTTSGTTTGADGRFSLTAPASAKALVISSIGFANAEIALTSASSYSITLKASSETLDEVVITAYGATKKKAFTGTASTIGSEKFKDMQVSSVTNVLQGQASGVLAVSANGQPGESPTIRVRGIGSVNASASPLIILDGAEYGGNINGINPNDIESITILKDASSTALYGSRAAGGVLNITTKTGKGDPKVTVTALTGWSTRAVKDYSYASSQQIYEMTWEALRNQAQITPNIIAGAGATSAEDYASKSVAGLLVYNPFKDAQPVGTDGKLKSGLPQLWNENWSDALLRTGKRNEINANMVGGNDRTRYLLSGGVLDDQGIAAESRFKRYTGRLKADTKVNTWLNMGVNTNLVYSTQNYPAQGGSAYNNVVGWIRGASSLYPVYLVDPATGNYLLDANGKKQYDYGNNGPLVRPYGKGSNPAGTTAQNPTSYDRFTTSANAYAEAEIIKGLKFRSQYAIDYYQYSSNVYYNPFVGDGSAYGGRSNKTRESVSQQTFTNSLTYDKQFGTEHHLNVVVGNEGIKYHDGVVTAEARGFTFPGVTELAYASTPYTATSYAYDSRIASYFGRANYDLSDKYHLSASIRRDGASRFADSSRWGTFYSIGGAWNINKESFMSSVTVLSDLKLRASYGTMGNQNFVTGLGNLYFPYLATYTSGANIAGYSGSYIASLANGSLTWEKQKMLDLGIDFGILKNRITGSFTYFNKQSQDLLFNRPLPPSVGITGISDNIGKLKNSGIEIDVTSININNKNFKWTTNINVTHIKNEIVQLPQATLAGANFSQLAVGQSLYNFYLREYAGVDKADGRPMWYIDKTDATSGKVTKDTTHTYSAATRYYSGSALPTWTGGMTNTFNYKGFDLTILASFSLGGKIYDGDYAGLMYAATGTAPGQNWSTDIAGRWQSASNPGDGVTPKLTTTTDYSATSSSTRFLYDASYARVRNITLGYNLPVSFIRKAKISNARVYVDWQNPITIFGRKGLDPEAGIAGVTSNNSTIYKTISVGLNFGF